jgi:2-polyprenyl-3-methyl-5-hydroxy-6-metoxy-1,4-benzoquinol methylase
MMDRPDLDLSLHAQALRSLARTNAWGSTRRAIWRAVIQLAIDRSLKQLRVLDIASGAGDLAIWLARTATRHDVRLEVEGCDISQVAVDYAKDHARDVNCANVRFFRCDVCSDAPLESYDVVMCSLFLHHLAEEQAVTLLAKMARIARLGVLVDDLDRTLFGYVLAWGGARLLTRSPVVHVDGPLSVRAAFSESELRSLAVQAGLKGATITRHWPQRFLLAWEKPWTATHVAR